jgi:two-component system, NarL family, invasion response regulator UvrY
MLRALIVEDSIPFREVTKSGLLSQFPSIELIEAGSGEEALNRLGSHPVDLVFMDIGLPGQSGLEATKRIKADYPDTTIAILTSYELPKYKEAAIMCGASCFIRKDSFEWKEIFTFIRCFQDAKLNGRKPNCIRFVGGFE